MKKLLYLGILVTLASCSSSKYAANFQKSNSGFGYGELVTKAPVKAPPVAAPVTESSNYVASNSKDATVVAEPALPAGVTTEQVAQFKKNYMALNKTERKEFHKALKKEVKKYIKAKTKIGVESDKSVNKTQMLDHDLKLAAIFGAIGIVALIISGNVFYIIGGIALIIGAVFFVMWLVRQ